MLLIFLPGKSLNITFLTRKSLESHRFSAYVRSATGVGLYWTWFPLLFTLLVAVNVPYLNTFLTLVAVVLSLGTARAQPTKTLTGRILGDDLAGVPRADICTRDTTVIGTTDMDGYFKIDVHVNTNTLIFRTVGAELTTVNLSGGCFSLEVILLYAPTYDFISVRRVNRQRFKQFKHLPQLHQQAYEKGLFKSRAPCASPVFTKWVPRRVKR